MEIRTLCHSNRLVTCMGGKKNTKIWRNCRHKFAKLSDKRSRTAERKNRLEIYFLDFLPCSLCLKKKTLGLGIWGYITQGDCQVENDFSWGRGKTVFMDISL